MEKHRSPRKPVLPNLIALSLLLLVASVQRGSAQTYTVLHSFSGSDGANPDAGVVSDSAGDLYGTTLQGGPFGYGAVYEMTNSNGAWTEQVIYGFQLTGGQTPYGPVVLDSSGNVYGTTGRCSSGCYGTAYQLTPSDGYWSETTLYAFTTPSDGELPSGGLIFDNLGTLYGATALGGPGSYGTVFTLSGPEHTTFDQIYWFTGLRYLLGDGIPSSDLVRDASGNLYGTTSGQIPGLTSTIFQLTPTGEGGWTENILYRFVTPADGDWPSGGLTIDSLGNLYGSAYTGGPYKYGVIYRLSPNANGAWTYSVLYAFRGYEDGEYPSSAPTLDAAGNLYGTTEYGGGILSSNGTVFKLTPSQQGQWTKTHLYTFVNPMLGANPEYSKLLLDSQGNIYGTTANGGTDNGGVVFEITP
jgi:uncharacterized repeat protein (TIGR03803 family)